MYKIVGITDKNGISKDERLKEIENKYSLYGELVFSKLIFYPVCFYFVYSDKMIRSSFIEDIEHVKEDSLYIITTRDSIYYIEEVDDENSER